MTIEIPFLVAIVRYVDSSSFIVFYQQEKATANIKIIDITNRPSENSSIPLQHVEISYLIYVKI